jgi:predicted ATPase/DNA-binding SARP family transcriptional activator
MEFRLLGAVECAVEQRPVPLGRPQERCVLAVLLLDLGRVVSLDRLVDLLWDDEPPARARSMVHTHVSRLRAKLREAGAERYGVRLLTRGQGYLVEAPPEAVDVHRFHRLVERARAQTVPAERAAILRDALALWHGPPLADAATTRIREQLCAGLDEQRISALEDRAEADLAAGRQHELVTELTDLVARHPLRERLVGLLMLALYRSGQQARALATYRATRQRLVDELGIGPSAALRRLEQSMLSQDPALDPPRAVGLLTFAGPLDAAPAPVTWSGRRSHLRTIVGRVPELGRLAALLTDHRLVTMVGVGGVGKTTLALHATQAAAAALARHVAVATLAPARGKDDAILAIAGLFGVVGVTVDEAMSGIERSLNERPYILVLDNCEHLVPECAGIVRRLLSTSPDLIILATSREPLGVPEETVWRLEPLAVPATAGPPDVSVPSVALFLRRVGEAMPGFTPTPADLTAIGRICRRVDGLPLALELAASRLRALTAEQLADHLEHGLGLITGNADAPSPLAATLEWSYRLLSPAEQRLIARLSVFRGGFDATAAERVCGTPPLAAEQILPTLAALLDRSLVQAYDSEDGRRYRLLEVVRAYAAGHLTGTEPAAVADRHLDYWLQTARSIAGRPNFGDQLSGWSGLGEDLDNLRAAAEHGYRHGRIADAVELTTLLFDCWMAGTHFVEVERWFERATPHLPSCRPQVRCLATLHRAALLGLRDDHLGALALLRPALPELRVHHADDYLEARITEVRTMTRLLDPAAVPLAVEVEEMVGAAPDPHHRLHGASMLAEALLAWGRYAEAERVCARMEPAGESVSPADTIRFLAMRCMAALGLGDLAAATATESLLQETRGGTASFLHTATSALPSALLALVAGPAPRARTVIADIVRVLDERYPPTMSRAYGYRILLAEVDRRLGHPHRARSTLAAGLAEGVRRTDFMHTLSGVLVAGLLATDLGDEAAGKELIHGWNGLRRKLGLPVPLGFAGVLAGELSPQPAADGLDPAGEWCEHDLRQLLESAHRWVEGRAMPVKRLSS